MAGCKVPVVALKALGLTGATLLNGCVAGRQLKVGSVCRVTCATGYKPAPGYSLKVAAYQCNANTRLVGPTPKLKCQGMFTKYVFSICVLVLTFILIVHPQVFDVVDNILIMRAIFMRMYCITH